jgi:hypothetical protein
LKGILEDFEKNCLENSSKEEDPNMLEDYTGIKDD